MVDCNYCFCSNFFVNLLSRGPDLVKYLSKPADRWYGGQVSWFDPWDHNVYFSAIGWGKRGNLAFPNLYDTQSIRPLFIYTAYVLIGKLTKFLNISTPYPSTWQQFFELNFGVIVWWFWEFLLKKKRKIIIYIILIFGGGLGWLFFPNSFFPMLVSGFNLESAFRRPHEAISSSLFLLTIGFLVRKNWKEA